MAFHIGDTVVHPQHGVGQVIKLDEREFEPGIKRGYYEVSIAGGGTIWVPREPPSFGLRKLAPKSEIDECRQILLSPPAPLEGEIRSRQTELADRLKRGSIRTQCEVVRDLYAHGEHKSLYGSMANFFRQTQNVLCQEWAMLENITLPEALNEVSTLLEKSRETLNSKNK